MKVILHTEVSSPLIDREYSFKSIRIEGLLITIVFNTILSELPKLTNTREN
jgi:hypothetical protein